ncbi:MAG TPA: PAS domain S-box protein [Candidatus Xenobia bacterium]|nr:PAS domain S-box protein [Candidatus Xenobia bacterium]
MGQRKRLSGKAAAKLGSQAFALSPSEDKFSRIFRSTPDSITISTLKEGRYLDVNESFLRLTGYSRDEVIGRSSAELRLWADEAEREHLVRRLKKQGSVREQECRFRTRSGEERCGLVSADLIDIDGEPCLLSVVRDITGTHQARRELEERTLYLNALLENNPLAVVVLDAEHRVRSCNPSFEQLFGYPKDEIIGSNLDELIAPADLPVEPGEFTQRILAGENVHATTHRRRKDGSVVEVELFGVPLKVRDRLIGVIGIYQDITERRRAEEARVRFLVREQEARAKAEGAERRFRELVRDLHAIVWEADAETFQFTFVSQRAADILGYPVERWLSEPDFWARHIHPEDRDWAVNLCRESTAEGRDHEIEYRMIAADGRTVWLWDKVRVLEDEQGRPRQLRGVMVDITEHMRAEHALLESQIRLRLLNTISTGMTAGRSVDQIINRTLREIGNHFRDYRAAYATLDDHGRMTIVRSQQGPDMPATDGVVLDLSVAPSYLKALRQGDPIVVPDVTEDPRLAPVADPFVAKKARALLEFPLHESGIIRGVLCLTAPTPHSWSENEMATLREVADYLSLALKNASAEEALRDSEARYRSMVEGAPYGIYRSSPAGELLDVNPALVEMLGYESAADLMRVNLHDIYRDAGDRKRLMDEYRDRNVFRGVEAQWKRRDGTPITVVLSGRPVRDEHGNVVHYEGIVENVTERRVLEEQLRQSQKIEAVGRLAGGIAHDFNNVLTAIMGYADLLADQLSADDPRQHDALEIRRAAERAAALTRQLLAFSRRQVLQPVVLDINNVVGSVDALLRRLIGDEVELAVACDPAVGRVLADPGQVEQVLMNLVVNARDAMPDGGRILVSTGVAVVGEDGFAQAVGPDPPGPGRYVTLSVSDTGQGIPPEILPHIFEPFFTTKPSGKGTGLGLATVYGIVKQSGGHIVVDTEPGRGTTFTIFLPETQSAAPAAERPATAPAARVLLVEDETAIRILAAGILRRQGYEVLDAATAEEALAALDRGEAVDLLLTDVVMPGMNGLELAEAALARRPEIKVVYMSGFSQSLLQAHGGGQRRAPFLPKPFTPAALVQTVRSVLEVRAGEATG